MLGLQASNLDEQERLFKNQIRLGLREILQQELAFYNQAFNNISSCASILAGFAFTGLMLDPFDNKNPLQPDWLDQTEHKNMKGVSSVIETTFNVMCALTTCLCLLTVVYSNYLGLFATRLALRGGEMAVEDSVMKIRGEYKVVLYALTASIESFILTLPVLAFYKMEKTDAILVTAVSAPSLFAVIYLYRRARQLFYLDKTDRFAAAKSNRGKGNAKTIDLNRAMHDGQGTGAMRSSAMSSAYSSGGGGGGDFGASRTESFAGQRAYGTRLSDLVRDVDVRNHSLYQHAAGQGSPGAGGGLPGRKGSIGMRRSNSFGSPSALTAQGGFYPGEAAEPFPAAVEERIAPGQRKAYWSSFFKKRA